MVELSDGAIIVDVDGAEPVVTAFQLIEEVDLPLFEVLSLLLDHGYTIPEFSTAEVTAIVAALIAVRNGPTDLEIQFVKYVSASGEGTANGTVSTSKK